MNKGKKLTVILGIVIVTLALMMGISDNVKALTSTVSNHTYKSYSFNTHNGEEVLINVSDLVNYYNTKEEGFLNTIEKNAWFYYSGGQYGMGNVTTVTPLTSGAGLSVNDVKDSNKLAQAIRIKGTAVGCSRMSGMLQWMDSITAPKVIHKYPFEIVVYNHVVAKGLNILSNAISNTGSINYYMYEGAKDQISTNVLPFNSTYITWDKVCNNAIQNISVTNSNASVATVTNISDTSWVASSFILNGLKEGSSTVRVSSTDNSTYGSNIAIKVLKKPVYSLSEKEITLAKDITVNDCLKATTTNLGSNNKCTFKWSSSNANVLEVKNNTSEIPTLVTKEEGTVTLKCEFTDLVATNNKSVNPTTLEVKVNVKNNNELKNVIKTSNNTYIEEGDSIYSTKEGDVVYVRVEEAGEEAVRSYTTSDKKICTVEPTSRSGYSFQIVKKGIGTAKITVTSKAGKKVTFKYVAAGTISNIVDPYSANIVNNNAKKPLRPKFKSVKLKNKKIYVTFKKKPSKYKAKGFQIKIKRNGKTIITTKWYKKSFKITNIKKNKKYTIYVRSFNGNKYSKWSKKTKKVKKLI